MENESREKDERIKSMIYRTLLGTYLLVMVIVLVLLILKLNIGLIGSGESDDCIILGCYIEIGDETRLLLLVLLSGALGSFIHASTSFASYAGNRALVNSWNWWYILRPFMGMALAFIFYVVMRAGIFSTDTKIENINSFGQIAIAGLVGMFSKNAIDKLREVFDNFFRTKDGDDSRRDKLDDTIPVKDRMIPVNKITACTITDEKPEDKILLTELSGLLKGIVTRIPIFDNDRKVQYIIHQSLLYKFIAEKSIDIDDTCSPPDVKELTLSNFLADEEIRELVKDSIAFVSMNATIGFARQEMKKIKNCQDVIVTENGSRDEPVEGWLTNNDIAKADKT